MTALIETLTSYIPTLVTRRLAADPAPPADPIAESLPAAVLTADISGFTALTEEMAERGPAGAEELARLLNDYFGQLIDLINAHGGDVVKFAGDALLALWPARAGLLPGIEEDLGIATRRAAQCALSVQQQLKDYQTAGGIHLSLRLAVGTGQIQALHLGGVFNRWEFVVTGRPLAQVKIAERHAQPGQVVVSSEVWMLIQDDCVCHPLAEGFVRLESVHTPLPQRSLIPSVLPPEAEESLQAYIPGAIISRLAAGQSGWLAELRRITVIFLNLPGLTYTTPLEQAQDIMRTLQSALYRYEGSVNKISVDDKGASLVAALGLPPLAHEDDAARGVQAALAMREALRKMDLRGPIGVTTGRVFCGLVGNANRGEYTMIGDVVNLAARLMQAAGQAADDCPPIFCDEATYQAARESLDFDALPPIEVKGKTEPVAIYCPICVSRSVQPKIAAEPQAEESLPETEIVGRTEERAALAEGLQALLRGSQTQTVIIEGEAGIGKSRLVEEVLRQVGILKINSLVGAGDAIEKSTPYHAWRPVFRQLFELDTLPPEAQREYVLTQLESLSRSKIRGVRRASRQMPSRAASEDAGSSKFDLLSLPDVAHLAPLLNAVLSLDLPDNELTAQMTGEVRADNIHRLLVRLLQTTASQSPRLLIIEDAHWLDSASWALLRLVNRDVHPLYLIVVARPMFDPPSEYKQLLTDPQTQHLRLTTLSAEEALTLVCQRLSVASLPKEAAELIRRKAEGHPFFSEELAYALRDAGLIEIADGQCRLSPGADDLSDLDFPDTIEGVVASRIDQLAPQQQLTLKVASVIGRVFAFRILHDVHPIEADKPHLSDHLSALERLDLTPLDTPEPDLAYIFKHIITQEVAYNLMAFVQRRQLHRAAAEWLERAHADDLSPHYPLLAHHWRQAAEARDAEPALATKALDYLEKAGEQALSKGAYQEAAHFFSEALALEQGSRTCPEPAEGGTGEQGGIKSAPAPPRPRPPAQLRRACWERLLGEARFELRQPVESRQHLQQALTHLSQPMPTTTSALISGLLGQIFRQIWREVWPARSREQSVEADASLLEAARSYEHLAQILYLANETTPTLYATFRGFNLAERAGPSPELARFYGSIYGVFRLIHLHRLAEVYRRQALEIAQELNDLSAQARVLSVVGLWSFGFDSWPEIRDTYEQSNALYKRLGDKRGWGDSLTGLSYVFYFQAQFTAGVDLAIEAHGLATNSDNLEHQTWALTRQAMNLLRLGQTDRAVALLEEALPLYTAITQSRVAEIQNYGMMAVARLRQGQTQDARQAAETTARLIGQSLPTSFALFDGYISVANVYLALWEETILEENQAEAKILKAAVQKACQALRKFAWFHPIGQPRAWLYQGWYNWLSGKPDKAHKAWRKSLVHAQRLEMPYEEGLAHYEIGRHLLADDPTRREHLEQALEIFTRVEAAYDLGRAREALVR